MVPMCLNVYENSPPTMVVATPDILIKERSPTDDFIILASDGLWDKMQNEQVVDAVYNLMTKHKCATATARELVKMAKGDKGTCHDDTTVVLIVLRRWWL